LSSPIVSAAAGVVALQVLLSATDYPSGESFDATYGGWGWQVWGGAAMPLSGRSRLFGEVFVNRGDVERDVADLSGLEYQHPVDVGDAWKESNCSDCHGVAQ